MRVAPEEKQMIATLAERDGLSSSDYLRLLVRKTYEATMAGDKPRKKSGKSETSSGTHPIATRKGVRHG